MKDIRKMDFEACAPRLISKHQTGIMAKQTAKKLRRLTAHSAGSLLAKGPRLRTHGGAEHHYLISTARSTMDMPMLLYALLAQDPSHSDTDLLLLGRIHKNLLDVLEATGFRTKGVDTRKRKDKNVYMGSSQSSFNRRRCK